MSQYLPYDEIEFDKNVKLEDIPKTPDDSDKGYVIECDLSYPDELKDETKNFHFCPQINFLLEVKFVIL